jgi:long-chain acyl-CoA synthetase
MNLVHQFLRSSRHGALIDGSDTYSYRALSQEAARIAAGLRDDGIADGDRVVVLANNSSEFIVTYLALLIVGAIVIPLDPRADIAERVRDLSLVKPRLIITSSDAWIPDPIADAIDTCEFHSDRWRSFAKKKPIDPVTKNDEDVAIMMMTAGARFQPRPAMLTHGSLRANLEQASAIGELALSNKDNVLGVLPMYHIFGLHIVAGLALHSEATLVISRTFDPIELSELIHRKNVSIVPGVPAMFDSFVREKSVTIDAINKVRLFVSGGAPMRSDVREAFSQKFGSRIAEGYGLTEASPLVSFTADAAIEGDIGRAVNDVDIEVRDSSGEIVLPGDVGEIVVRGPNVFAGYYNDREATKEVLDVSGWLHTGDVGLVGENGSITLIDRSSDVIVVSGFSVFPSEVENVLIGHELVRQASVVGELNDDTGESVVAYVDIVDDRNDVTDLAFRRSLEKELFEYCWARLARYKVPDRFVFIDEQGFRASSRPLKRALRAAFHQN